MFMWGQPPRLSGGPDLSGRCVYTSIASQSFALSNDRDRRPVDFVPKIKTRPTRAAPVPTTIFTMARELSWRQQNSKKNQPPIPILGIHPAQHKLISRRHSERAPLSPIPRILVIPNGRSSARRNLLQPLSFRTGAPQPGVICCPPHPLCLSVGLTRCSIRFAQMREAGCDERH
jgi:hypothetical protein